MVRPDPAHSTSVASRSDANEEDLGGRCAYVFCSGEQRGVTLDPGGDNLPDLERGLSWTFDRSFTLGVRDVGLEDVSPEVMIRGILARGYYVWSRDDPSRMAGTSQ